MWNTSSTGRGRWTKATLTAVAALTVLAAGAAATTAVGTSRIAGVDRYDTAVQLWRAAAQQQCTACLIEAPPAIVSGDSFADALGASADASNRLLLSPHDHLTAGTADELRTWAAKMKSQGSPAEATIWGGTAAIGDGVAADLTALGLTIRRIAGRDRYETALLGYKARHSGRPYLLFLASGDEFADAITIGPALRQLGFLNYGLLLTPRDAIPPAVLGYIMTSGSSGVMIVGGVNAVSENVRQQLGNLYVDRIAGADRYETAAKIADFVVDGHQLTGLPPVTTTYLANGVAWPDALASAANVQGARGVLLLTPGDSLAPPAADWLQRNSSSVATVIGIGGLRVLAQQTIDEAAAAATSSAG